MVPVIPCVLNLNAIKSDFANKTAPLQQDISGILRRLISGDNNDLVNPEDISKLIDLYGPDSDTPYLLSEVKPAEEKNYPYLEIREDGSPAAYYFFQDTTGANQVSFEADVDTSNGDIELRGALLAPNTNLVTVFYHSCCAHSGNVPFSTFTALAGNLKVKSSMESLKQHGNTVMMRNGANGLEINCDFANARGMQVLKARRDHILGTCHDHSSHPTLSTSGTHPKAEI